MSPRAFVPRRRRPARAALSVTLSRTSDGAVRIECSECPPSINQITSMIPIRRAREARRWVEAVRESAEAYRVRLAPPIHVVATYHWATRRRRDLWNYPPKWPVDGLVAARLIPDDDAESVTQCAVRFARSYTGAPFLVLELSGEVLP